MVVLRNQECSWRESSCKLLTAKWQLLACVYLSAGPVGHQDKALLINPQQQHQMPTVDYVQPLQLLLRKERFVLWSLDLSNIKLGVMGPAVMAQLSKGNWPSLSALNLSDNHLDVASIAELTQVSGPGRQ